MTADKGIYRQLPQNQPHGVEVRPYRSPPMPTQMRATGGFTQIGVVYRLYRDCWAKRNGSHQTNRKDTPRRLLCVRSAPRAVATRPAQRPSDAVRRSDGLTGHPAEKNHPGRLHVALRGLQRLPVPPRRLTRRIARQRVCIPAGGRARRERGRATASVEARRRRVSVAADTVGSTPINGS